MNAVALLTKSHRNLEKQLEALKEADPANKADFDAMADELAAHITVEEELFYPAIKAKRTKDILLESLEEHLSLKRVLADLLAIAPDDEKFGPKMHVLAEQAEHHHKEEEDELFPKVKKLLDSDQLESLGAEMESRMKKLEEHAARKRIPAQTSDSKSLA